MTGKNIESLLFNSKVDLHCSFIGKFDASYRRSTTFVASFYLAIDQMSEILLDESDIERVTREIQILK